MAENARKDVEGQVKDVHMGLGDAIRRLMHVEHLYTSGVSNVPEAMIAERDLIIDALNNQFKLDLGFDCNTDGVPDDVGIFEQTVTTSCCRILPHEIRKQAKKGAVTSRRPSSRAQKKSLVETVVRQHRGLAKTTTPRERSQQPPPIEVAEAEPATRASDPSEILGTVARRVHRGLAKGPLPDPTPA